MSNMNDYKKGVVEALLYSIHAITNMTPEKALENLNSALVTVNIGIVEDFAHKTGGKLS